MIRVKRISKFYGYKPAVSDLTFNVEKGEILGFLGPNGAGKTTTMRMLTCYLPPTSGTAEIFGRDIIRDSMHVRRMIGYLPEKAPSYHELNVHDYLEFSAKMKSIPKNKIKQSIDYVIEKCGLTNEFKQTIGNLSKGYQQRVGLAQAIINDPEFLILDEPTIGLDPKQVLEIRKLIKSIGSRTTVLLSSHILPEVSQICDRIIIINKGKLIAVDSPENLRKKLKSSASTIIKLRKTSAAKDISDILLEIGGVLDVTETDGTGNTVIITVKSKPEKDLREKMAAEIVQNEFPLLEIYNEELTLEDIFMELVTTEN
ncbi:MAG: ABC transporter ATP-binding protein [Candidatus Krumholzibacteriota bacterium]|nr:ABC transporter ATP-binding protein [Candidatus Krumholzibacteriota bacterium]